VSNGTISTMRAKWRQIRDAGDTRLLKMSWSDALRWAPDGSARRGEMVQDLLQRLVDAGIARAYGAHPDIVTDAFHRIGLPMTVPAPPRLRSKRPQS
jgi:hypothetical protein